MWEDYLQGEAEPGPDTGPAELELCWNARSLSIHFFCLPFLKVLHLEGR